MNRQKYKNIIPVLIICFVFSLFLNILAVRAVETENNLESTVSKYYNKYSLYFDQYGLRYASPTYGVPEFKKPETAREIASLSSYYKYRSVTDQKVRNILRQNILKSLSEITSRDKKTLSFNDTEALFLIARTIEHNPKILSSIEQEYFWYQIEKLIQSGISAPDTENRAIISAVHWQYLLGEVSEKRDVNSLYQMYLKYFIKQKIDTALEDVLVNDRWYLENRKKDFSPHYQAVTALMLTWYFDQTEDEKYLKLAENMYEGLKMISFGNGMVEAKVGQRPVGLGSQFYLMMSTVGSYLNDSDSSIYLDHLTSDNYFSDARYPDRLEFHPTDRSSKIIFHDDYAFSDKAEISLLLDQKKSFTEINFSKLNQTISYEDSLFKIKNIGNKININNRIFQQTKSGNQTVIY
jgi:hypothetical protein